MQSKLGGLALVLGSCAIGVVLVELAIRILAPQPLSGSVFEYAPRGYSVIKSTGTSVFRVGDRKGVYHFTTPHLRGEKAPSATAERILVLGDSFTFGVGLNEDETYVAKLQKHIDSAFGSDHIQLLNAGIGGSGTSEHLAFIEDFGKAIGPHAVLVIVSIDDFGRAERSPLYSLRAADGLDLNRGYQETNRLKKLVIGSPLYNFLIENLHIAQLLRQIAISLTVRASMPAETGHPEPATAERQNSLEQQRLARALFRRMKEWCDANNVALAVINNGWRSYPWLGDVLASERIRFFDAAPQIQPAITRDPGRYVIPGDGHPDPEGATLVAEAVWPFVESFIRNGKWSKNQQD